MLQCTILLVILIEMLGFTLKMQLINFVKGTSISIYTYEGLNCDKAMVKDLICVKHASIKEINNVQRHIVIFLIFQQSSLSNLFGAHTPYIGCWFITHTGQFTLTNPSNGMFERWKETEKSGGNLHGRWEKMQNSIQRISHAQD